MLSPLSSPFTYHVISLIIRFPIAGRFPSYRRGACRQQTTLLRRLQERRGRGDLRFRSRTRLEFLEGRPRQRH